MATTIGTAGLIFGVVTESGGICQSFSQTRNIEKAEVRDIDGDVSGVAYYNNTDSYSLSLTLTGSSSTTAGATISLANATCAPSVVRIDSITINKSNDGFVTADISATGYPNV